MPEITPDGLMQESEKLYAYALKRAGNTIKPKMSCRNACSPLGASASPSLVNPHSALGSSGL